MSSRFALLIAGFGQLLVSIKFTYAIFYNNKYDRLVSDRLVRAGAFWLILCMEHKYTLAVMVSGITYHALVREVISLS